MKVYLDNCCFNRPFDSQADQIIILETLAKLCIQKLILNKKIDLVWSYILEYENGQNILESKKDAISKWKTLSVEFVNKSEDLVNLADEITKTGIKPFDALHIACAITANCNYIITVDKRMTKFLDNRIVVCNPIDFIRMEDMK